MKFCIRNAFKILYSKNLFLLLFLISLSHCIKDNTFYSSKDKLLKNKQDETKQTLYKYYEDYFNPKENNLNGDPLFSQSSTFLYNKNGIDQHHINLNQIQERKVYQFNGIPSQELTNDRFVLYQSINPQMKSSNLVITSSSCDRKNGRIVFKCDKNDIYCLCKNHPNYKQCVCSAYPKSIICSDYCLENPDDYFCNPQKCSESNEIAKCDKCFCKYHVDDVKCKCKSNPYTRECFCLKNPLSHLCNPNACKYNPNSLFCSCQTNLRENMCTPRYCYDNPTSPYCKCIVDPYSHECSCLNDPNSCSKREFMEAIVEFDLKIRDVCSQNKLFYTQNPFKSINENNLNNTNYVIYDNNVDVSVVDPTVIFNMYYPPCNYNPDEPNNKQRPEPCIPFPEPPKPCKGFDKDIPKNMILNKPCVYQSGNGSCLRDLAKTDPAYRQSLLNSVNNEIAIKKNEDNLKNVKLKFNIGEEEHSLLMLYNKILLFNQLKCQSIK